MKKLYFLFITLLITSFSFGQIVINEIDADQTSTDTQEFIELKWTANTALDGYVVVLFNGSDDLSYMSYDLDGKTTDANGFFILANTALASGADIDMGADNAVQNGADAVAIYQANDTDFPNDTAITLTNLIDVVVYGTSDGDDSGLLTGFGETVQYDENANSLKDTESLQRTDDGSTFVTKSPTFRSQNFTTDPTLTLVDGPANGSTLELSPEDLTGDLEFSTTNFVVDTNPNGDGYIAWNIEEQGVGTHDSGNVYDTTLTYPIVTLNANTTYIFTAELLTHAGASLNPAVVYSFTVNTNGYTMVSDLAALRAGNIDDYYQVTGEIIGTFSQSFRNQKWAEDATAGILIDDNDGIITTAYIEGDGITGLKGQLTEFAGTMQLVPTVDPGAPSSTGNTVTPQTVSMADLTANGEMYESELVKINEKSFFTVGDGAATFSNGTIYAITGATDSFNVRTTFYDVDYIGTVIPYNVTDLTGIITVRNTTEYYLTPRNLTVDLLLDVKKETIDGFALYPNPVSNGYITINTPNNLEKKVNIFDVLGKQVYSKTIQNGEKVDVTKLNSGVYILRVEEDAKIATRKLIIR